MVKRKFCEQYKDILEAATNNSNNRRKKTNYPYDETFTDIFVKILNSLEKKSVKDKLERKEKGPRKFSETNRGKEVMKDKKEGTYMSKYIYIYNIINNTKYISSIWMYKYGYI